MTWRVLLLACIAATISACQSVPATDSGDARRFLERIYSNYQAGGPGARVYEDGAPELFAPELLALIREDLRIARKLASSHC